MARAKYNSVGMTVNGVTVNIVPNAEITLYEAGTTTPLADTIYRDPTGIVTLTNPFFADAYGNYTFYLDTPKSVKISATGVGIGTFVNDFEQLHPAPEDLVGVVANRTIKTSDGLTDLLRVDDGVTFIKGPVQLGTDLGSTSDSAHVMYIHKSVTGSGVGNIVDTFLVEMNGATNDASDIGSVAGFARALAASGKVSLRGLAGQLMVDLGAQTADREAIELGVHNAKAITSKADNRTVFSEAFGTVGALISAYSGTQADGNPAQRPNTAIVINTFGGVGGHWKQFIVAYDGPGTKAFQLSDQGNIIAGGGGNNQAEPVYGFLDTLGDKDTGVGFYWGGNDVIGVAINSVEVARFFSSGLQLTGNFILSGSSRRAQADYSNATVATRAHHQSSTTNGATRVGAIPNGTGTASAYEAHNNATPASGTVARLEANATDVRLESLALGGSSLPLLFYVAASERARLDTSGNLGVGGTAPAGSRVYVTGGLIEAAGGIKNSGSDIGDLSIPAALTVTTHNYVPSTGVAHGVYQISATGAIDLTGLALSQTVAGHRVTLINGGGNTITLKHASASSPANPFNTNTGLDHALTPGKAVSLIWTGAAWRFYAVT